MVSLQFFNDLAAENLKIFRELPNSAKYTPQNADILFLFDLLHASRLENHPYFMLLNVDGQIGALVKACVLQPFAG